MAKSDLVTLVRFASMDASAMFKKALAEAETTMLAEIDRLRAELSRRDSRAPSGAFVVHHKDHPPCLFATEDEARDALADRGDDYRVAFYYGGAEAKR